jgi:uncharacterized membrane protein YdjX (TVP38/TMEM64 family)
MLLLFVELNFVYDVDIPAVISFPPMIGHTTTLVLCGFAYGVKGFYLAAGASVFAAALVFVILRLAFRRRLRELSSKNEKWQALETVIVGYYTFFLNSVLKLI